MSLPLLFLILVVCIFLSAVFSGTETGFYSLSPLRVEARASAGHPGARRIQMLLHNDTALLTTILVGNNLMLELATLTFEGLLVRARVPTDLLEVFATLVLTPVTFFFGELLPKDLFRRRPHALVSRFAWIILIARVLLAPLALPLRALSRLAERTAGLSASRVARAFGREKVVELLEESARGGSMEEHVHDLVQNVLGLRGTSVAQVLVPWRRVRWLSVGLADSELRSSVAQSNFTRLPVVDASGAARHYVHQLDVLGVPDRPVTEHLRPLLALPPELSVDRALGRMRNAGQRAALVGTPEAPLGLVTLKDLVEEISGELGGW
jgi:CBS domain containing-hemolysin-like protein